MRCCVGDLAVVSNPSSPNYGKFVTVLRPMSQVEVWNCGWIASGNHVWLVQAVGALLTCEMGGIYAQRPFSDFALRPIRDPGDDATDEMVERVGKPQEVTA